MTGRKRLFPIGDIVGTQPHANYDISPDGKTFVVVRRSPAARIVVIQNLPGSGEEASQGSQRTAGR